MGNDKLVQDERARCAYYVESLRDMLLFQGEDKWASEVENIRLRILDGSLPNPFWSADGLKAWTADIQIGADHE